MQREIRPPTPADVAALQDIERSADAAFEAHLGPEPFGPDASVPGEHRVAASGFVLVAAEASGADPIGFVHVVEVGGAAHLEQLSVLPSHARRGHGAALVEAACEEASRRGHDEITLRTYAQIPFNATFYARRGFTEVPPPDPRDSRLADAEHGLGLERHGRRMTMRRGLAQGRRKDPASRDGETGS